ncbi:DUF262 domain-containing protein [soil metagenome]
MAAKNKTAQDVETAEKQIKELQIPYDYDTKEYPIEVLLYKFNSNEPEKSTIIIPTYQREFIWRDDMKSRFIESLLLGVPIQPLFAAILDEDGTLELIDGSQRLRTIEAFQNDEFKLSGLKKLKALNGFSYSDFTPARKNKFGLINLRLHVINEDANLSIRQDIFDRINTSGMQANAPEIRKGALAGKFYAFVMECAKNELFNRLCPITKNARKRGEAEELILRFFTYADYGTDNKEKGSRLLDNYLIEQNDNEFDQKKKRAEFERMLKFVNKYFELGFKKTPNSSFTPRVRFEAISLGIHFAMEEKPDLKPAYMDWLNSKEFENVTTSDSSNNPGRLTTRVNFVRDCLLNKIKKDALTYEES